MEKHLIEQKYYIDGKIEGVSVWYPDSDIFICANGELHGVYKYYNPKGELIVEGQYKKGKNIAFGSTTKMVNWLMKNILLISLSMLNKKRLPFQTVSSFS